MSEQDHVTGGDRPNGVEAREPDMGEDSGARKPDMGSRDVDIEKLTAELEKWKHFARRNEENWKRAAAEAKSAAEEARQAALAEVAERLTIAEVTARAARHGVALPDSRFINVGALMSDGEPDAEAIDAFLGTLPKAAQKFDPLVLDTGSREANTPPQLTRADLANMSYEEIDQARREGRLNDLLGI